MAGFWTYDHRPATIHNRPNLALNGPMRPNSWVSLVRRHLFLARRCLEQCQNLQVSMEGSASVGAFRAKA